MVQAITTVEGIPAIPDVRVDDPNLQVMLDTLKESIEVLTGTRGDPNSRALTYGEASEGGLTDLFVTNRVVGTVLEARKTVTLVGDIIGTADFLENGVVTVPTAINLPNITLVSGGDAAETFPGEPNGPYGVLGGGGGGSALTVQDDGVSLSTGATLLNFVGVTVTEPTTDQITITFGPAQANNDYFPNYSYNKETDTAFTVVGVNAAALFRVGRRLKFTKAGADVFGVIASVNYNITSPSDTYCSMTMESAAVIPTNTFDVALTTSGTAWSPIAGNPSAGEAIRDIATGAIGGTQWWVIVGDGGFIATSTDGGASWTTRTSGTTGNLYTVIYDPASETFYAGGSGGTGNAEVIKSSTNGTTWSAVTLPWTTGTDDYVSDMTRSYVGTYIAVSVYDSSTNSWDLYITSDSFATNTARANGIAVDSKVAANESPLGTLPYWAYTNQANHFYYTAFTDATPAVEETAPDQITANGALYINGPTATDLHWFYGCGSGAIGHNRPGIAASLDDVTFANAIRKFAHSELHERTVCVGDSATIGYLPDASVETADAWTSVPSGFSPTTDILCVEFNETDGVFVACAANGQICRSSNGIT